MGSAFSSPQLSAPAREEVGHLLAQELRPGGDLRCDRALQRNQAAGIVRIQSFRVAADIFIIPMLASFCQAYPDIVLDVEIEDQLDDFVASGFDAAIRVGEVIARVGRARRREGRDRDAVAGRPRQRLPARGRAADVDRHRAALRAGAA